MREMALFWIGLAIGLANALRHRLQGYKTPRTFASDDYAKAGPYDAKVVDRWERYGAVLEGHRVLEIGPGPDLGTGAIMLGRSASSYLAVDIFPLATNVPEDFYLSLGADPSELGYLQQAYPHLPDLSGPFDLVVSNASLEHVDDVPGLFRRLAEVVPSGGQMVHYVDAKTHTRGLVDRDPLNVFRYPPILYKLMRFPGMLNRLLADDYVLAADAAGFDARTEPGKTADPAYLARTRLNGAFAHRPDLSQLSFALIARRR